MTPLVTFRTSPEERAAWRDGPHPVKVTLDRDDLCRLLDDIDSAERALCTYPHCAGMRNAGAMIQRFKQVADAADLLFRAIQDRVGSDEFERYAELLRECLVKAGYGGE